VRGVAEACEHLGAAFGDVRRERHVKTKSGGGATPYGSPLGSRPVT
jgi:hypothetical protein